MKVYLSYFDGTDIGEREWPYIPRVGESVLLADPPRSFRVDDISWDTSKSDMVAHIYLRDHHEDERQKF